MTNRRSPSDVVGERVRDLRKISGYSVEDLAERCGGELSANAIYLIEGGRKKDGRRTRKITVDELMILARALGRSPIVLLLPDAGETYRVAECAPDAPVEDVYRWIIGEHPAPGEPMDEAALRTASIQFLSHVPYAIDQVTNVALRAVDALDARLTQTENLIEHGNVSPELQEAIDAAVAAALRSQKDAGDE